MASGSLSPTAMAAEMVDLEEEGVENLRDLERRWLILRERGGSENVEGNAVDGKRDAAAEEREGGAVDERGMENEREAAIGIWEGKAIEKCRREEGFCMCGSIGVACSVGLRFENLRS